MQPEMATSGSAFDELVAEQKRQNRAEARRRANGNRASREYLDHAELTGYDIVYVTDVWPGPDNEG